ncbi:hypothetical protein BDR22DRAFT_884894 [Usnea florida]
MLKHLPFAQVSDQTSNFLHLQQYKTSAPGPGGVLVRMLAAPINPQDVMVLAGRYPVKPENHEGGEPIPGYDEVAEVVECGDGVTELCSDDRVVPKRHGLGTWRTHAVFQEASLVKVSSIDMARLRPGDWIIQNAASGCIAQMTRQFARLKGLHSIIIVRDRADVRQTAALKDKLLNLGVDVVLAESELATLDILHKGKRIMLALDSVFGPLAAKMTTYLSPNAMFVNYGSLGVEARSGAFELTQDMIFWKQITFRNFRLSTCLGARSEEEIRDMLTWFGDLFESGVLKAADVITINWDSRAAEADIEGVVCS